MPKLFSGLRWKLTFSYTVVTVATLLVVELLLIGGISLLVINSNILPYLLIYVEETFIIPQVATYLDKPQPDIEALTDWLDLAYSEGITFQSPQDTRITVHIGDLDQRTTLMVLDANLDRIAGIPQADESASNVINERASELLVTAQSGEKDPAKISNISNGVLTTALPVTSENGRVLGVVVMMMPFPPSGSLIPTLSLVGASLIIFAFAAGIVGTIFGYITARGLTKRLRTVSLAADSWSQGDFSAFIQDRSGDELSQLSQQLNRMAEQLQNLLQTKQELATLEERNRLARDLHDSVKQQVFATAMQVGAARALLEQDSKATLEHLNEAEQLARQAQTELALIIRELRPSTLQDRSLAQAIKEYIAGWSRLNNITAEVNMLTERALPLDIEQALFRVFQEALSNIARHSKATHIEVQLACENNEVSISVSDNGIGFDVKAVQGKGVGLRSMRERMAALGGSMSLNSSPGQGTHLTAHCPISNEVSS